MTKHQDILLNKARLRSACSTLNIKQLTRINNNISEFIAEKEQQWQQAEAEAQDLKEKKQQIMMALSQAGLTLDDLLGTASTGKRKLVSKPASMKYSIKDKDGIVHQWSGRGRTPKAFAEFFANGGSKEACKIN